MELIETNIKTDETVDHVTGEKYTEVIRSWKVKIDNVIYVRCLNKKGVEWYDETPQMNYLFGLNTTSSSSTYLESKYSNNQLESFFKTMFRKKKLERL